MYIYHVYIMYNLWLRIQDLLKTKRGAAELLWVTFAINLASISQVNTIWPHVNIQNQTGWCTSLYIWLVVGPPLWKIWKSIGMIIPNIWENKIDVPNHQPDIQIYPNLNTSKPEHSLRAMNGSIVSQWYTTKRETHLLRSFQTHSILLTITNIYQYHKQHDTSWTHNYTLTSDRFVTFHDLPLFANWTRWPHPHGSDFPTLRMFDYRRVEHTGHYRRTFAFRWYLGIF